MNFSLCKKFSETYGTPRGLMGMVMFQFLCARRSFASVKDLLRHLFDSLHMRATFAHPSSWKVLAERLDGDSGHSLLYESARKSNLISKAEQLLNGSHATIGETNFPLTE